MTQAAYVAALKRLARRDHSKEEMRRALARAGLRGGGGRRGARPPDPGPATSTTPVRRPRGPDAGCAPTAWAGTASARTCARAASPATTAEGGLAEALAEVPEAEALDRVAQRYWKNRTSDEPRDRLRKLWAFLVRRGFPADLVRARLAALWPRWRDALDGLEAAEGED